MTEACIAANNAARGRRVTCHVLKHLLHDVLQLVIRKVKLVGEIDWPGRSVAVAVVAELCDVRGQASGTPVVDALVQPVTTDEGI